MKAICILTEIEGVFASDCLNAVPGGSASREDERTRAAIRGLGKTRLKAHEDLLPFIADPEENVANQAISAFGENTPDTVITALIEAVIARDKVAAPAA